VKLVITCEHGGNAIPEGYQDYFINQEKLLNSHTGYDLGTLHLFGKLKELADFSIDNEICRLLIEYNRSQDHEQIFSVVSKNFSSEEKEDLISNYYLPYRDSVEKKIEEFIHQQEKVVHLSLHSFTPILDEHERNNDIGLLYDSDRIEEVRYCDKFRELLLQQLLELRIRSNFPYLGTADGLTTYLRKQFPENYLGIELEVNQKWVINNRFKPELSEAIFSVVQQLQETAH
jgi:predicted N-formylglutamate amidohydrolase